MYTKRGMKRLLEIARKLFRAKHLSLLIKTQWREREKEKVRDLIEDTYEGEGRRT